MSEPIVDLLISEWEAVVLLGSTLADTDWDLPTDLPGWSVRDNISHLIGIERTLLGDPPPSGCDQAAKAPHVKNAIGEMNEKWVASRRDRVGPAVLSEFEEVVARRMAALETMSTEEFDKEGWTPVGQAPYREFMAIRLLDTWAHEQDIRRAVGKPGNLDGPVAEKCLQRVVSALPYVVGKKAATPDGSLVAIDLTGPIFTTVAILVEEGRAKLIETPVASDSNRQNPSFDLDAAICVLAMSSEALCCLGFGRWEPEAALAQGRVTITGDSQLGHNIVSGLPFMI